MTKTAGGVSTVEDRVRAFYATLAEGRGDDVADFVRKNFSDDAVLIRPESLPGGGPCRGSEAIAKFMRAAARSVRTLELRTVHTASSDAAQNVFAEIELNVGTGAVTAIEWWTFTHDDGKATSMRAFYWDTAAMLAGTGKPADRAAAEPLR